MDEPQRNSRGRIKPAPDRGPKAKSERPIAREWHERKERAKKLRSEKKKGKGEQIATRVDAVEAFTQILNSSQSDDARIKAIKAIIELQGLNSKQVDGSAMTESERIDLLASVLPAIEGILPFRVLRRAADLKCVTEDDIEPIEEVADANAS